MQEINFDIQKLKIKTNNWDVDLIFESYNSNNHSDKTFDYILKLNDEGEWTSKLVLLCSKVGESNKKCLITGIDGGCYFHLSSKEDNCQSVKIVDNQLIMSLGFSFVSLDLDRMQFNWIIRPDIAEVFEFYDLENDFLLRGELCIHRIDRKGNVKWSFGGRDIWVNPDGEKEVTIEKDKIILVDFESNRYIINFDGIEI